MSNSSRRVFVTANQGSLFGDGSRRITTGPNGQTTYFPARVEHSTALAWFAELRDSIAWQSERRRMYDRDVDVPRLVMRFAFGEAALPAPIVAAARVASRVTGQPYNSAGLNYYRDGRDSVAPHNDKLHMLVAGCPIAILSLGATRRMVISTKATPRKTVSVDLENGSILLMDYQTQLHFNHGIPKVAAPVGGRISITFRMRPDSPAA